MLYKKYYIVYTTFMEKKTTLIISDFSTILSGYSFRGAMRNDPSGDTRIVQAKDVRGSVHLTPEKLSKIHMTYLGDRLLMEDDVILSARGAFIASVVNFSERAIATSSVYIIRPDKEKALPLYLAIYLNSLSGQNLLKRYETASTISTILIRDLRNIRIPLPAIEYQKEIISLYNNINTQKNLLEKKERLITQILEAAL